MPLLAYFNRLFCAIWRRRKRPVDIAKTLDGETLQRVLREARFLAKAHGVEVRELASGEEPSQPKPASALHAPPAPLKE